MWNIIIKYNKEEEYYLYTTVKSLDEAALEIIRITENIGELDEIKIEKIKI